MKVFVDCRWYSQPGQGVVTYLSALHKAAEELLRQQGRKDIEFWYGVESISALDAQLIPPQANLLQLGRRSMLWRLFGQAFWLRRQGFDVAHFQYVAPIFKLGMRYVSTIHDILFKRYPELFSIQHRLPRDLLYSLTAKRADLVLTVSERSAQDIVDLMQPRHPPRVIYNGCGIHANITGNDLKPVPSLVNQPFLLTVGRVEPRKNYGRLLQAFAGSGLATTGMRLVVVGFCDAEFADEITALRNTPGVVWLDRVPESQLTWLYQHAKAFVYPSLCEGFGIPVLEAIEAGLPYAVSSTFPLSDVIEQADLVFDPTDTAAIARALQALCGLHQVPQQRKQLLRKYAWANSAKQYIAALDSLAPTPGLAAPS